MAAQDSGPSMPCSLSPAQAPLAAPAAEQTCLGDTLHPSQQLLGMWDSGSGLAPLLHSPTLPLVTFCANKCFPGESEFIRETESSGPRLPTGTGTERPSWQADHPSWPTACAAGLQRGWMGGRRAEKEDQGS